MCNLLKLLWTPSLTSHCRSVHDAAQTILQTTSQEDRIKWIKMSVSEKFSGESCIFPWLGQAAEDQLRVWCGPPVRTWVYLIAEVLWGRRSCRAQPSRQQSGRFSAPKRTKRRRANVGCFPATLRHVFNKYYVLYVIHRAHMLWQHSGLL